jgi:hypothetical protein
MRVRTFAEQAFLPVLEVHPANEVTWGHGEWVPVLALPDDYEKHSRYLLPYE